MSVPSLAQLPAGASASYRQWAAHPALTASISCVWVSEGQDQSAPPQDRVLPDGCIDIVWGGVSLFVAGPDTGPVSLASSPGKFYAGIRFRPGRAHQFFDVPAWELVDQRVPLADLWGKGKSERASERLQGATSPPAAAQIIENDLLAFCSEIGNSDPVVDALVLQLGDWNHRAANPSPPRVADISRRIGVSDRELLRRCRAAVGYGPKTLDRILRFQHAWSLAPTRTSLAELAVDCGYADQAHLARECQRLAGLTPSVLFKTADNRRS